MVCALNIACAQAFLIVYLAITAILLIFHAMVTKFHSPRTEGQPTQQELPEAHHRLDDAKHRLDRLLAQAIELASLNGLEAVLHPIHGAGRLGSVEQAR